MKVVLILSIVIVASLAHPYMLDTLEDREDLELREDSSEEPDDDEEPTRCSGDRCDLTNGGKMYLKTGQQIESNRIRAVMQEDGNFVVYCKSACPCRRRAVWSSNTYKAPIDTGLQIGKDGNMILYRTDGDVAWQSGTHDPGAKFRLVAQEDSNLVMFKIKGGKETEIWSSNTHGRC